MRKVVTSQVEVVTITCDRCRLRVGTHGCACCGCDVCCQCSNKQYTDAFTGISNRDLVGEEFTRVCDVCVKLSQHYTPAAHKLLKACDAAVAEVRNTWIAAGKAQFAATQLESAP